MGAIQADRRGQRVASGGRLEASVRLPMFPLGTVLFPHMVLPLHVFEPRYRVLTRRCLDGEPLFGVVLIARGNEVGGGDERSDVGTVARIAEAAELEDGRYVLVTVGTKRLRVTRWLEDDPHPWAEVELLDDVDSGAIDVERTVARLRRVLALMNELGAEVAPATTELSDEPLARSWQAATLAPLGPLDAQRVLETDDAGARIALLDLLLAEREDDLSLQIAGG